MMTLLSYCMAVAMNVMGAPVGIKDRSQDYRAAGRNTYTGLQRHQSYAILLKTVHPQSHTKSQYG